VTGAVNHVDLRLKVVEAKYMPGSNWKNPRNRSIRLLESKRKTYIQDRRGNAKHRSNRVKLGPMLEQSTRLCCTEISTRRK
jgi:hypothetical protein